jgi:hypothetical protein
MSAEAASSFIFSFPWDIERLIFEEAAGDDRQTALRLAFVSKNVQSWSVSDQFTESYARSNFSVISILRVEPVIYQVVTLDTPRIKDAFLRSLEITTKPTSFYNQCIKALYLPYHTFQNFGGDGIEAAIKLLPYCKGVEYFVCWISPGSVDTRLADVVTAMRPRKLIIRLTNLLGTPRPKFSLPFFDNVTHLEITDSTEWTTWSGIHLLPRLSHLLLHVKRHFKAVTVTSTAVQIVSDVLSHCGTLQVCVIRRDNSNQRGLRYPALDELELINDDRLVFILKNEDPRLDWLSFVKGKPDTWAYAESAVARQRQNGRVQARLVYDRPH